MDFLKKLFSKLFGGNTPTYVQSASTALKLLAPTIQLIMLEVTGDEGEAEAKKVLAEIQTDLALALKYLQDAHTGDTSTLGTALGYINAIGSDLPDLLAAGHIKNTDKLSKVTALVQTIVATIQTVVSLLPKQ